MNDKICYIFGAGERYGSPPPPASGDFVIAVDGGYDYAVSCGITPDLLIGDFDSISEIPEFENTITLPKIKNDTDMSAALREGFEKGYRTFYIYGGTGGRISHTLANIQSIADASRRGGRGFLFDKDSVITVIHNSYIEFGADAKGFISVFAFGDIAEGVTESGLKYSLTEAVLRNTYPLGVSNEFCGKPSRISVKNGTLTIVYSSQKKEN
jgi:thiamine pyrophosphokinase